jgi:hypothetical protein
MDSAHAPWNRARRRRDAAAPVLLPAFFASVAAVVLAVVALVRLDSDLADAGAIALVVLLAGALLVSILRLLSEPSDEPPDALGGGPC